MSGRESLRILTSQPAHIRSNYLQINVQLCSHLHRPHAPLLRLHVCELESDDGVEAGLANERFEALDVGGVDKGPTPARLAPGKDHVARRGVDLADVAMRDCDPSTVEQVGRFHLRETEEQLAMVKGAEHERKTRKTNLESEQFGVLSLQVCDKCLVVVRKVVVDASLG